MRLLVVTPDFPPAPGGIQRLVARLVASIEDAEILVVTLAEGVGPRTEKRMVDGVRVASIRSPFSDQRLRILDLNRFAVTMGLRFRAEVTLGGHVVAGPAMRALKWLRGVPYVVYLHGHEVADRPALSRFSTAGSHAAIHVSRHTRNEAVRAGVDDARLVNIPPGVDLATWRTDPPGKFERPTVITVARMVDRYKGHDMMLEAVEALRARHPQIHWVVVGDGPLRQEYEQQAAILGIGENVTFAGNVSDAERDDLLRRSHVFAMPSRVPERGGGEGFGIVYLEAGQLGLPVVAGDEGGSVDAVRNGQTGLLVDPRDSSALAAAIGELIDNPQLAHEMGLAGRRLAEQHEWPTIAVQVRKVLQEAIS